MICRLDEIGQPITVGIALADKVGPVPRHPTLKNIVIIIPGDVRVIRVRDVVECVPDLRSMVCPFLAIISRSASEIVRIHIALCTSGHPVDCPAPGSDPAEIAEKLIAVLAGLGAVTCMIKLEKLACEITEEFPVKRAVCRDVVLARVGTDTGFVLVASEDRDIGMSVQEKGFAVGVRENIAVEVGTPHGRFHECGCQVLELGVFEDRVAYERRFPQ